MNLLISKCVTGVKVSKFTGEYLPNRSNLDIGVLGFFGIVSHKEHPPEIWFVPPVTLCICIHVCSDLCITCDATGNSVTYSEYENRSRLEEDSVFF